jgi:membrane-bound lytic murein transglycosylase D
MPAGKRLDFQSYTVRKGDTLAKVAKRFKLTPEDLLAANDLTTKQFRPGKRVLVPPPPVLAVAEGDLVSGTRGIALGDRLLPPLPAAPRDLDSPLEAAGKPEPQTPVQPAVKPVPVPSAPSTPEPEPSVAVPLAEAKVPAVPAQASPTLLRAKQGDTLAKLARAHRVSLGELMRLNPEAVKELHPGDEVRLPGHAAVKPASATRHRVQKGDTLTSIAEKYGLEPRELKAWNRLKGDRLLAGQKLRLTPP